MRRIDRFSPPRRDSAPMAAHRIRNIVHEVLLYSHDLDEGRQRAHGPTPRRWAELEVSVQTALREAFFDLLYVDRPMVDELYNALHTHRLTLMSGPRGSGKTTVLLAFDRRFCEQHGQGERFDRERDTAGASVHYINIRQFEAARKDPSVTDAGPRLTVCAFIFGKLERFFFPTLHDLHTEISESEQALRRRWVEWKTQECHTHKKLKAAPRISAGRDRGE